nr:hypothetical protein [Tanacetum cinerariifolium]
VCKSLTYLIKDYDYYEKKMVQKPLRNHAMRGNFQHYARMSHPHPHRHVVPIAVLTRSRFVPLTAAKPVTTYVPQIKVKHQRPTKHVISKAHSPIRRPINLRPSPKNSNFHQRVTTVKTTKDKELIDSVCSSHMTGNISYLSNFEEINRGYVTFGGNPKGGKIKGKGSGPTWLFDIDTLTQSMNYQPVVAGNPPTSSADPQNTDADATFEVKEPNSKVHVSLSSSAKTKKHDDKTKRKAKGNIPIELSTRVRDLNDDFEEFFDNITNVVNAASTPVTAVRPNSTNSTNTFSVAGPSNNPVSSAFEFGDKFSYVNPSQYPDDPDMPALEDITY